MLKTINANIMKSNLIKRIIVAVLFILVGITALTAQILWKGIYYDVSYVNGIAEVTYNRENTVKIDYSGSIVIPSVITPQGDKYPLTVIGITEDAFAFHDDITSVSIPNTVTSIGACAFIGCTGLTSITIPNSVTNIGYCAFNLCEGLTSITIPASVNFINTYAFNSCKNVSSITVAKGNNIYDSRDDCNAIIKTASDILIQGCNTTKIPNTIKSIERSAFSGSRKLSSVSIPNSVTKIGEGAFNATWDLEEVNITDLSAWCNIEFADEEANPLHISCADQTKILKLNGIDIKDMIIPNGVTEIKQYAFCDYDSLKSVVIPNSVIAIGYKAFYCCDGITSVVIPNSVTSVGKYSFYGCDNLKSLIIGNSVDTIDAYGFGGEWLRGTINSLNKIVSLNPTPPVCENSNVFYEKNYSNATLYVPKDSFSKYFIHDVWGKFANIKKIETVASEINLSDTDVEMNRGENITLSAKIIPSNTTLTDLSWESSNTDVVIVDQTGKITALKPGKAIITVRALDGSNVMATCNITVKGARIKLSHTEVSLPVNDIMTLSYTVEPKDVSIEWSSSDLDVAYIKKNSDGSVTVVGMADGVATITARALDGSDETASCLVKVGEAGVEGVEVDDNVIEIARYDIYGRLLSKPVPGINIVKYSDGNTRKLIIKH